MFYLDLFRALEQHKVRYLLVGGLAMNLHGVPRTTMDVDLLVALDAVNLKAFLVAAEALRLSPMAPVSLNDMLDPVRRQRWLKEKNMLVFALRPPDIQGPTVDVLIDPPIDIEAALTRTVWREVQGAHIPLISVEDLIHLKEKSGRAQDRSDIEHLRRLAGKSL
ncbi:MAG: hypothetical protein ACYDBW_08195 [Sulfuricaulis sp.]